MQTTSTSLDVKALRDRVSGRVIAPGDDAFDSARMVMIGGIDRRPAAIVRVSTARDVVETIRVARDGRLPLAIRSGGHSATGAGVVDDGIVIDLRDLNALDIDVDARTAWAGAGLTAAEYSVAAGEHGLATGFGDTGSVGIGGITLGGGVGYLVRKYGLTIDDLLGAEVVTADGRILEVDAGHEPDLFWAIRGGGGNFGVVTRFHYRLHDVPSFVGGMLMLPATADVVAEFIALAERAPDELSTIANVMNCPPMPFVPAEHHGTLVVFAIMAFAGDEDAGQKTLAPFRTLATPIVDMLRPMPYAEIYPPDDPDYHPKAITRTMFVDSIDRDAASLIIDRLGASDASVRAAQLRVLGGAMARVPVGATAFAHRASRIMVNVAVFFDGPDDLPARQAWAEELAAGLRQGDTGAYVNFLGDEGEERIRAAYPGRTFDRLAEIKARYDPANLFRLNQNIRPAPPR